jgi:GTP-binding protein HflX
MKKKDPLAFIKARQAIRSYGAITVSAHDAATLSPLLEEMERRFWPEETD